MIQPEEGNFQHTNIREVRVNYPKTEHQRFVVSSPEDVASFVRSVLPENSREYVFSLYLDVKSMVLGYSVIGIGGWSSCTFQSPALFQRAILLGAEKIVVAHNHPTGIADPSIADMVVTRRLIAAGKLLGIEIMDHVIVTDRDCLSLRALPLWEA